VLISRVVTNHKTQRRTLDKVKVDVEKCFAAGTTLICPLSGMILNKFRGKCYMAIIASYVKSFQCHAYKVRSKLLVQV
jgi:hypothetical protein